MTIFDPLKHETIVFKHSSRFLGWIIESSKWKSNSYGRIRCDVTGAFATWSSFVKMFKLHYCSTLGICHRENASWNVSNGNWKYSPRTGSKFELQIRVESYVYDRRLRFCLEYIQKLVEFEKLSGNFWTSKALKGDKELTSEVFNWSQPAKNKK